MEPTTDTATGQGATASEGAQPQSIEARREAIIARVRAGTTKGGAPASGDKPDQAAAAPAANTGQAAQESEETETETETDEATEADAGQDGGDGGDEGEEEGATQRIAALSARNRELEAKLSAAEGKATEGGKYAGLGERVKADPGVLFDEFPDVTLEALSEAYLKRQEDPGHRARAELAERQRKLEADLQKDRDERQAEKAARVEAEARAEVSQTLAAEAERWPICARKENVGEAIGLALQSARAVAAKVIKKTGKAIDATKANAIMADCLDETEKELAARGKRYAPAPPKPGTAPRLRSIGASTGSAGAVRDGSKPAPKLTREQIVARVRAGQGQPST